ncbi:MAG: S8 family serine peptidase [Candidatus Heimdallarchaeota archaeon]
MFKYVLFILCSIFVINTSFSQDITDEIVVKYISIPNSDEIKSKTSIKGNEFKKNLNFISSLAGVKLKFSTNTLTGVTVLRLNSTKSYREIEDIASVLEQDFNVEYAYPNHIGYIQQVTLNLNDPAFVSTPNRAGAQWSLRDSSVYGISMESAWYMQNEINGSNVIVAVIDTGYTQHPDLKGNIIPGYDLINFDPITQKPRKPVAGGLDLGDWTEDDDCGIGSIGRRSSWHGTQVASIIAAKTGNNRGIAGIAFKAKILPVRIVGQCGASSTRLADAIYWAASGPTKQSGIPFNEYTAHVINISLGYKTNNGLDLLPCPPNVQQAIDYAVNKNITVVVAAGNSGNNSKTLYKGKRKLDIETANNQYPSNCKGVISVANTDISGRRVADSAHGSVVTVSAPGNQIPYLTPNDLKGYTGKSFTWRNNISGTSYSAPHVAGVAALLYGISPRISTSRVKKIISSTALDKFHPGSFEFGKKCSVDRLCGTGILNAKAALASPMIPIIDVPNLPPKTSPDTASANGVEPTVMAPLSNDAGVNGEPIRALLGSLPVNGKIVLNSDKATFTYTHDGSTNLTDRFTYMATNGIATSAPVTVSITIGVAVGGNGGGTGSIPPVNLLTIPIQISIGMF